MYLADSNIIIYSYQEQYKYLRTLILEEYVYFSEISRIEVLGYHLINLDEEEYFKELFKLVPIIVPSKPIFDKAIEIRKVYNLELGDSLIAATALVNDLVVYTRNTKHFGRVDKLKIIDPIR